MPRTAPGVIVRGRLRRKYPKYHGVSVTYADRCWSQRPHRAGMGNDLYSFEQGAEKCGCFTRDSCDIGVVCGRLGEVVSLVGDCRPPPPGSPHRPTKLNDGIHQVIQKWKNSAAMGSGDLRFSPRGSKNGGIHRSIGKLYTFNMSSTKGNLKILVSTEYFKNTRSYYYCLSKVPVLEFEHFRSYLYGLHRAEPLSIAITNVLENQG